MPVLPGHPEEQKRESVTQGCPEAHGHVSFSTWEFFSKLHVAGTLRLVCTADMPHQ